MRRRRRFLFGLLIVPLVLVAGRLAWFLGLSEPSRQIMIGRETTYLDGPLTDDGYIDYIAAAERQCSEGVTPENNAAVLLWEAFGAYATSVENWQDQFRRLRVPVPANSSVDEIPLDLMVAASRRPRCYSPFIVLADDGKLPRMMNVSLALSSAQTHKIGGLAGRAGQRMGAGDVDGAWDDILACHRLARLVAHDSFVVNSLQGMQQERVAFDAAQSLMVIDALTAEQARRCVRDLEALPQFRPLAEKIDYFERLVMLDAAMAVARGEVLNPHDEEQQFQLSKPQAIDWNTVLEQVNDYFDQLVSAARDPDAAMRLVRLKELREAGMKLTDDRIAFALQAFLGGRDQASRDLAKVIIGSVVDYYPTSLKDETSNLARIREERIGFALTAYQREHGAYPETLASLIPGVMQELPADPWTGHAFVYCRIDDGFVLYSAGPNQRDDGGRFANVVGTADGLMDDIIVRIEAD